MPSTKVTAATIAAAVSTVLVWLLHSYASVTVPDAVQGAIVVLLTLLAGYLVPEQNPSPSGVAAVRAGKGAAR
jgi:hypothetical protein